MSNPLYTVLALNGIKCSQDCCFCIHIRTLVGLHDRLYVWKGLFYGVKVRGVRRKVVNKCTNFFNLLLALGHDVWRHYRVQLHYSDSHHWMAAVWDKVMLKEMTKCINNKCNSGCGWCSSTKHHHRILQQLLNPHTMPQEFLCSSRFPSQGRAKSVHIVPSVCSRFIKKYQ